MPAVDTQGLSEAEAAARLRAEGFNELPSAGRRSTLRIVADVLREPMFSLLIGAAAVYLVLGSLQEALALLAFATLSVSIAVLQENRSERVIEALRDLASPRALVVRDGRPRRIPGREVVRGDLILIAEGDRVPADALVVAGEDLHTDESLLTGESVPVRKHPAATPPQAPPRPGGDDLPYVFSGTLVVRGSARAVVTAIGAQSEIGRIGRALGAIEREAPRLQTQTRRLVRIFAAGGLAVSAVLVVLYGVLRGDWLDALLAGIALGMSMLPEEFPLVLTVFMVMGAWRISRARVLTRRASAIETLGSATVLCTDKTGTLTLNRMSIAELRAGGAAWRPGQGAPPPAVADVVEAGALASTRAAHDPMDRALHELAADLGVGGPAGAGRAPIRQYGMRPDLLAVVNVWPDAGSGPAVAAAKGAPEAVAELCGLAPAEVDAVRREVDAMAAAGMRVLGVARAAVDESALPDSPRGLPFRFLGLVGFADPLRPSVPAAVEECRSAGIRVIMITGDYPATAGAIARQAGIDSGDVVVGDALQDMDEAALRRRLQHAAVFARTVPDQKLRIVEALKANGEVVAMTGDGVNDAPSLKAAHIGIAMGGRGSDVAREAASIVLLDDDFGSIVRTIRLGRRIYDNLRKAMGYILALHVPIAGLALLPLVFGLPPVLTPMLIALIEMIIDPACSIVLEAEPEEADVMRRPPRDPRSPLLSFAFMTWSAIQGVLAFLVIAAVFVLALRLGLSETEVRSLAFMSLVVTNIALIFVNRSFSASLWQALARRNPALWLGLGPAVAVFAVVLLWPPARDLFRLGPLHGDGLVICLAAFVGLLVLLEGVKRLWRGRLLA
ncbi:MAG: cation-translocating P-type ATPase [Rhodospirillaceae bacterium]|nr:cation-translocating P-type ATPase [Rhodospirillaceae bacterium]